MKKNEISISEIFHALLSHIVLIMITALVCGMAMFAYTKIFIKPLYQTSIMLYSVSNVNPESGSTNVNEQNASTHLATFYAQILKSDNVMGAVSEELKNKNLTYDSAQLKSMVSISTTSTQVFSVYVTAPSAYDAKTVADVIADVASDKIVEIVGSGDVRIVDYARLPESPSSPSVSKNTAIGVLIGLLLAALFVILRSMTDSTIWTEEDMTKQFDIPVLGTIPQLSHSEKQTDEKEQK